MTLRRGLTLVEVLAATILLAVIAATCTPLIRQATHLVRDTGHSFELFELSRLADELIADPTAFGVESLHEEFELQVPWPDHLDRPAITARWYW